jgi:hypothetical protein
MSAEVYGAGFAKKFLYANLVCLKIMRPEIRIDRNKCGLTFLKRTHTAEFISKLSQQIAKQ